MSGILLLILCLFFAVILIVCVPIKRRWWLCILLFPLVCNAQKINRPIVLNEPQFLPAIKEFYVAGVVDERENGSVVASLLPAGQVTSATPKYTLDIKDGAAIAIKQFTGKAVPLNKALRPVIIHIKRFRVDEALQPDGRINGKLMVVFSFWLQKDEGDLHLVDYGGGSNYTRSTVQQMDIAGLLSNTIQGGLIYFNTWINKQADSNIKLAKGVKLIFTDYTEQPEGDTIYYSAKRPLTWADFKQKPPTSKYEAEVFPSIAYAERVEVIKGIVNVNLSLKPYLPKSACWVKDGSRNAYSLNHEQRHFDIVKLVMEHFKQQLLKEKLTVENYDGPINVQYLDSFREMNQLEEQYDLETSHGMNTAAQEEWNKRIDKELR
ncbi:hypothetical protein [Mucilaginibacter sp. FT3.2]|uniref:hypothetical protein n=1 Tax=Mucilaginibacter sp. FT3.2 TaxID=2723090 RepID=UPI00161387A5|nr:hypothetical protein [Mucilaginibacter sp. FT3.2]